MAKQQGRRNFIFKSGLVIAGFPFLGRYLTACTPPKSKIIAGALAGPSAKAGHLLRSGISVLPEKTEEVDIVIVGGGVSGLSANRWLHQNSAQKVVLLEMEKQPGGNTVSGKNEHTAFPWGAHYLTLPNNSLKELLDFLTDVNVITGYNAEKLPIYNDYYLCFDPEERLFINGYWQQGLIPNWGVPEAELTEIDRFFSVMDRLRWEKGNDSKYAFNIPVAESSVDVQFRNLDVMSMHDWLLKENFTSAHLHWYVNYCCLDDYGSQVKETSAWAGIHYFASRRAQAANVDSDRVLTWPEGNSWLTTRLRKVGEQNIRTSSLTYRVSILQDRVAVDFIDMATNQYRRLVTKQCILATPQFVNDRLLLKSGIPDLEKNRATNDFSYSTWLVANITLKQIPAGRGASLSWDNVIYNSSSLGYVYANQQQVQLYPLKQTITFYMPLTGDNLQQIRGEAYRWSHADWQELVLRELEKAHPTIRDHIEQLDTWVWGHGMIRPTVGFIWGEHKTAAANPILDKIFFAHSDLSGISVFEEAFYQGINAAKHILKLNQNA